MDGFERTVAASLKFKLSFWLTLAIVIIAAAAGVVSFVSATAEANRMQDNQLLQTGYLISRLDAVPSSPLARERAGDVDFDARVVVRFLQTGPGLAAAPAPRPPMFSNQLGDGLQTVFVGKERWRVFVKTNAKGVRVAVGQQTSVRDAAASASALRTLMPILMLVPVLVLLVGVLLRQMFKPFKALADELGRRTEADLGPLDHAGLPSEVWPFVVAINALLVRMGRSLSSQRRFIADAAHELRSPLTAMSLQAERLGAANMPGEARTRLQALIAGLQRTRILLDQMLALARAQESRADVTTTISLQHVIRDVLEDLVPIAEAKNIDVGVIGDADGEVNARGVDLKVLVKNLLDNAIRYTPNGGRVDITVHGKPGVVTLQVEDTGPGIAPEERERVFDSFYRVLGNGEIGSGLGLAITRTVADSMAATIELSDARAPHGGLRVVVTFRAAA
ncbi:two-component sensor histidine kinase [Massilia eurypsychrophila]|uniref:histidine kinase n=1 Tax=Massilia eurypsychrophila TaxID=1485217 RepID=A0A2G8TI20_9BURK|nr:ATP-binding protein [Massilia eurypsychrophila]PIL45686.1 two-component sensor histidine kinase [Massilia eurypsychrophila]